MIPGIEQKIERFQSSDGTRKRYEMIKDAAADIGMLTSGIHHSIKFGTKTAKGILFIRDNGETEGTGTEH